jgi:hypothetical protein
VGREADVARAVAELPRETIVYAHNGGRFDFHYLLPWFDAGEQFMLIRGRIARAAIAGRELRDSWLLLPEPLARTGLKGEIDYSHLESAVRERHREEIAAYLRQDCEALYDLLAAFFAEHGGREAPLTLPAAALRRWTELQGARRPSIPERLDETLRPFYFGGRVEARRLGVLGGPWRVYDVNSAYASAMLAPHPIGRPITWPGLAPESEWDRAFAIVTARSDGALPVRLASGEVTFPTVARGRFLATGHELRAGLETGRLAIDSAHLTHVFPDSIRFERFIEYYWKRRVELREAGDHLGQLVAKRTMNAVYGKLGQDPRRRFKHALVRADAEGLAAMLRDGWSIAGALPPWLLLARANPSPWGFLHVGAAASITGAVRARLLLALHAAREPVYCDTDSIICRALPGARKGAQLGDWKLEATLTRLAIVGKKLYAGHTRDGKVKLATKGVRLTSEQIFRLARDGGSVAWEADAPTFQPAGAPRFLRRVVGGVNRSNA